jgi:phosphatidylglycerophosphatase A
MEERARWARLVATWFGCGKAPVAPGTVGAFGAIPLHVALTFLGPGTRLAVIAALTALGTWASDRLSRELGEEDPQSIVIDEVVGTLLALHFARGGLRGKALAFAAFRVLDVVKPWIIDDAQRLKPAGVGIMADDVLAGIAAGLVTRVFARG